MKSVEVLDKSLAQQKTEQIQLQGQMNTALQMEKDSRKRLAEVTKKHEPLLKKAGERAGKNTNLLFGFIVAFLSVAITLIAYTSFSVLPQLAEKRYIDNVPSDQFAFFLLLGFVVCFFVFCWGVASKKRIMIILGVITCGFPTLLLWAGGGSAGLQAIFIAVVSFVATLLIARLIRKALFQQPKAKYRNIYELLYPHKEMLKTAREEVAALQAEHNANLSTIKNLEQQTANSNANTQALIAEQEGVCLYQKACEAAKDYPQQAVTAYGMFYHAYQRLGELGNEFFALRSRMESEDADTLYHFALEFCNSDNDFYEFLRLLQLAINKGSMDARSTLGRVMAQVSAAAGNNDYESAYMILQPLIDAGSTEALNIKLQLDNNKIAEQTRKATEKARAEAAQAAREHNAALSAAQQAVLGQMSAIRSNQEFSQMIMLNTIEDARRNGIKIRTGFFD